MLCSITSERLLESPHAPELMTVEVTAIPRVGDQCFLWERNSDIIVYTRVILVRWETMTARYTISQKFDVTIIVAPWDDTQGNALERWEEKVLMECEQGIIEE